MEKGVLNKLVMNLAKYIYMYIVFKRPKKVIKE